MTRFPIPAPPFDGRSRTVEASAPFEWIQLGWSIFMVTPGQWVVAALIAIVAFAVMMIMWLPGQLLACLLTPVLMAGSLFMCHRASTEGNCTLQDLAAGFKNRTNALMLLGLLLVVATLLVHVIIFLLLGSSIASALVMPNIVGLGMLLGGSLLALLLSSVMVVPLTMALWFAPALVFFNDMAPFDACKASFNACLKNILPFLILGLVLFVLSFIAALPVGLGFLILLPLWAGVLYASYQDVFIVH